MSSEGILIREKYLERIRPYYEMDTVKVIVGPRRAGKSVILNAVKNEIKASKHFPDSFSKEKRGDMLRMSIELAKNVVSKTSIVNLTEEDE